MRYKIIAIPNWLKGNMKERKKKLLVIFAVSAEQRLILKDDVKMSERM